MWLFTQDGFLSAVQHRTAPDLLVVRARVKADITHLAAWLATREKVGWNPDDLIESYDGTDYPFRVIVTKGEFWRYLRDQVDAIDYGNYKDRVAERQGKERSNAYTRIWHVGLDLEREDPERDPARVSPYLRTDANAWEFGDPWVDEHHGHDLEV